MLHNVAFHQGLHCLLGQKQSMEKYINRGSYMSAHVLLNLFNKLGKRLYVRLAEHFISFSQQVL